MTEKHTSWIYKKVFLVSDKSLVDAGVTAKIETVLKNANIE